MDPIPFDTKAEHVLEDEVVRLRPLTPEDFDFLLPFSENEPDLFVHSLVPSGNATELRRYIDLAVHGREKGTEYPFVVFDKRTSEYAGSTRYYDIQPQHQSLQLGSTWYGRRFQRTGLNLHCKLLLLEFAFEKAGMFRVEFRADNENARSIEAMEKLGCVREGVLRSNCSKPDGGRRDSIVLSILRHEWEDTVKDRLLKRIRR